MSELILKPSVGRNCAILSINKNARWNPTTGQFEGGTAGQLGQYARYFGVGGVGYNPADSNAIESKTYIDFYLPLAALDLTQYQIDSVQLKVYAASQVGYTPVYVYSRRSSVYRAPITSLAESLNGAIFGQVNGTALAFLDWSAIGTKTFTLNLASMRTVIQQAMAAGEEYLPFVLEFNKSLALNTLGASGIQGWQGTEEQVPQLVISYSVIQKAGVITGFQIADLKAKYRDHIDTEFVLSDTEGETQTLLASLACDLGGGTLGSYVAIETFSRASSVSGIHYSKSFSIASFLNSTTGLFFSMEKPIYDAVPEVTAGTAWFSTPYYYFAPNSTYQIRISPGRLKAGDVHRVMYEFNNQNFRVQVFVGFDLVAQQSGSLGVSLDFTPTEDDEVVIRVANLSSTTQSRMNSLSLQNLSNPNTPINGRLSLSPSDNDGSGIAVFLTSGTIPIDNRIPLPVPSIYEANTEDRVWQSDFVSASFSFDPSPTGGVSHYVYRIGSEERPILNDGDTHVNAGTTVHWDIPLVSGVSQEGAWYFAIAPVGANGLIGDTTSFGFYFNSPASFVVDPAPQINGRALNLTDVQFVPKRTEQQIGWTAPPTKPGNTYKYHVQAGVEGTAPGHQLVFDIEFSKIGTSLYNGGTSVGSRAMTFWLTITDYTGIPYVVRKFESDFTGLEYSVNGTTWLPVTAPLVAASNATKVRYTLQPTDYLPEKVSLHAYLRMGYFESDPLVGGKFLYSLAYGALPMIFSVPRGMGNLVETQVNLGTNVAVDMDIEITYLGDTVIYRSSQNKRGFLIKDGNLWRPMQDGEKVTGNQTYRFGLEPFMGVPANASFSYRRRYVLNGIAQAWSSSTVTSKSNPVTETWSFTNPEIDVENITGVSYLFPFAFAREENTYLLRFRVWDGWQYGDWTDYFRFRVNQPPASPRGLRIV